MLLPRTTRQLVVAIAVVAISMVFMRSCRPVEEHPYYYANRAATNRRLERTARLQAVSARMSAFEKRREAELTSGPAHQRLKNEAERLENKAAELTQLADEWSRGAVDALRSSRESGHVPSEFPEFIRRELKPEDLDL